MKTPHELMSKLDQIALHNGNGYNDDILEEIKKFESDILADKTETRIKEFTLDCQFIFEDQAREYCRLHGVTNIGIDQSCINIAGAIMSARKDQDKIIKELSMIVRMLVSKVNQSNPGSDLTKRASEYLKKNDLEGNVLRESKEA